MTFDPTDPAAEIEFWKAAEKGEFFAAPPKAGKLKKKPVMPDVGKLKEKIGKPDVALPVDDAEVEYAPLDVRGMSLGEVVKALVALGALLALVALVD